MSHIAVVESAVVQNECNEFISRPFSFALVLRTRAYSNRHRTRGGLPLMHTNSDNYGQFRVLNKLNVHVYGTWEECYLSAHFVLDKKKKRAQE